MWNWWRVGVAATLCGLLAACGGGGGADTNNEPLRATRPVALTVVDTDGRFVADASITVGTSTSAVRTSAQGTATIEVPSGSEQVLRISKQGYAVQVQPITLAADDIGHAIRTMLVKREAPITIANIENGGSASARDGAKVEFAAASLVDARGNAVSGSIEMLITPINPRTSDWRAFPGSFEGTAPGQARAPIVSFGTVEFVPVRGGEKLNLAAGKTATIEMPLYATSQLDGSPIRLGDRVPFWSLDERTGVWVQEGEGIVVSSEASPTGRSVRGTISHFSWWNLDKFAQRGRVCVAPSTPTPPAGLPANQPVLVEARVVSGSGPTSAASRTVPHGARTCVPVAAGGTVQFDAGYSLGNQDCTGSGSASASAGGETSLSISMTCVTSPRPYFVQPTSAVLTNSRRPVTVEMQVDGETPDTVELLANGNVVASFSAQFFYRHFLDTSSYADGSVVTLQVRATKGGVQRQSNVLNVNIDRTPPSVVTLTPATTEVVDRATEFKLVFDEPVNAAPLTLDQVLRFEVRPAGQPNFTPLAFTMSQSTNGREVTVRINQELPVGTVSMSWGAFKDVAGNAVADPGNDPSIARFVSASWQVNRATQLAGFDSWGSFEPLTGNAMARAPGGALMAVSRPFNGNDIVVSVYDAATDAWAPHPAGMVNDRPLTTDGYYAKSLAFDAAGVLHVLLVQPAAGFVGVIPGEMVLKKLDNNAWVNAAPPLQMPANTIPDIRGSREAVLRFDASNRPVVAVPYGARLNVHRVDGGVWVQLGQLPVNTGRSISMDILADGTLIAFDAGVPGLAPRRLWAFRNGNWVQEGAPLPGAGPQVRMVLQNNVPTVIEPIVGQAGTIDVYRLVAGSWQTERVVFSGVPEFYPGAGDQLVFDVAVFNGNLIFASGFGGNAGPGRFNGAAYVARQLSGAWSSYDELTVAVPNDGAILLPRLQVLGNELFLRETDFVGNRQVPYRLSMP